MEYNKIVSQTQVNIQVQSKINDFFNRFQIGTLMHRCGVRKRHGHSIRSLTEAIFILPFIGKNFYRGIVINEDNAFGKDAAYQLLRGTSFNWRRLLLFLGQRLFSILNRLTNDDRESVLILDDSTYDRSRSKLVELLSKVYDHSTGRFLKGFRMLTICWSDGASCLPLDFSLLSSREAKKRICESKKDLDKRCCAYRRRKEATMKATELLEPMVKRILNTGIQAQYLLMDSWFTMPSTVITLAKHIKVIGMIKKSPKIFYTYDGNKLDVMAIYRRLKKRRGRAKILAIARNMKGRTKKQGEFGEQLDSLIDMVSFGICPAVFLLSYGQFSAWYLPGAFVIVATSAIRLSYFNVFGLVDSSTYKGLALDNNVIVFAFIFLFERFFSAGIFSIILYAMFMIMAGFNLSSLRTPKFSGAWFYVLIGYTVILTIIYSFAP